MLRERLEAIQLLDYTLFILCAYVWLIDSSFLLLVYRLLIQIHACSPSAMGSSFTLPGFGLVIVLHTLVTMICHAIWDMGQPNRDTILLDFVGRDHHFGRIHLITLDLVIATLQLLTLTLAFETTKHKPGDQGATVDRLQPDYISAYDLDEAEEREDRGEGQGWSPRDEEAKLFSGELDPEEHSRKEARIASSLTHPIAVFQLRRLLRDMWRRMTARSDVRRILAAAHAAQAEGGSPRRVQALMAEHDRLVARQAEMEAVLAELRQRRDEHQSRARVTLESWRSIVGRNVRAPDWLMDARQRVASVTPSWRGANAYSRVDQEGVGEER